MVLNVNNIYNNSILYGRNLRAQGSRINSPKFSFEKNDSANDGKFSAKEALKNFAKGLVSPITSMFSSGKNFLISSSIFAGTSALVVATNGAIAPVLVAAGVVMGAVQAGKAALKIAKAKNGDDVEKAFYDIGGATTAVGLSTLGAKTSLRQVGMQTEKMNVFKSTVECFKNIKPLVIESFSSFKSGTFKTNIYNAVKPYLFAKRIRQMGRKIFNEGIKFYKQDFNEIKSVIPEEFHADLKVRPKNNTSILDKLIDRAVFYREIRKIKRDNTLTQAEKDLGISKLKAKRKMFNTDDDFARKLVDDLVGTRLVVKDPVPENIDKIVNSLVEAIKNDKIVITEIKNYYGAGNQKGVYFNENHIAKIKAAADDKGITIKSIEAPIPKDSGYCTVQMKIKHKSGNWGELQIRGKHINEIENVEHIVYDLKKGKDIVKGNLELSKLFYPIKNAIKKLSPGKYSEFQDYIVKKYKFARAKEMGIAVEDPILPNGVDKILDINNLKVVYENSQKIKLITNKKPLILPQIGLDAGVNQ